MNSGARTADRDRGEQQLAGLLAEAEMFSSEDLTIAVKRHTDYLTDHLFLLYEMQSTLSIARVLLFYSASIVEPTTTE